MLFEMYKFALLCKGITIDFFICKLIMFLIPILFDDAFDVIADVAHMPYFV